VGLRPDRDICSRKRGEKKRAKGQKGRERGKTGQGSVCRKRGEGRRYILMRYPEVGWKDGYFGKRKRGKRRGTMLYSFLNIGGGRKGKGR